MTFNFDGSACEHATCAGAPEMFIKVEEDGLYYFGVEADDTGSISIANEKLCEKDGTPPNGKLNLATGARYLKAGYYKVALSYTNNAYNPVSNNAAAFNVTMDREPIQAGKYEGNSTMKREFSPSPKIKLWTIEKESTITCEESRKVEVTLEEPAPVVEESIGDTKTSLISPQIIVTACKDEVLDEWRLRVQQVSAGSRILLRTGGYRDALKNPPVTEDEAVEAVTAMNRYQSHKRGAWHTQEASLAHEKHHRRECNDALQFYWDNLRIQDSIELKPVSCEKFPKMDDALAEMRKSVLNWTTTYLTAVKHYIELLPDDANDRPYCAGQKVLNEATRKIIAQAKANGWSRVPDEVTEPGTIEPPCFLPPVNGMYARSVAAAEEPASLTLSIADTSRFREGRITVRFRNEGNEPVRIPDEINDETADYFFVTVLRTERGDVRILNREIGTMTFQRPLNYRELAPGQEYSVTIPVCLDEVDLEGWKQCSCELETRYYNQQGERLFPGDAPGDGQARAAMKKIFRYLILLTSLSLHAAAWGGMADNGVECSVVMEKTRFDARETFPDFKLVFTNKGEKTVRLFDDFYPLKDDGPNIRIEIWEKAGGKRYGYRVGEIENPIACYIAGYKIERVAALMRFITLKPGEKHEVPIKEAYLLLTYFDRLRNDQNYELEVRFRDGYAYPDARRVYVGKAEFSLSRRSPKGVPR